MQAKSSTLISHTDTRVDYYKAWSQLAGQTHLYYVCRCGGRRAPQKADYRLSTDLQVLYWSISTEPAPGRCTVSPAVRQ